MSTNSTEKTIELSPGGRRFTSQPSESLLESGLGAGIALPFGCANGSCGDCRARVLSGEVRKIRFHDYALTASEKLAGVCLLCSNTADTDLVIEVEEARAASDIPVQKLRAKLCHSHILDDVSIVRFKLSRGKALRYLPGQYATVHWQNGRTTTLPIANCPCEPDYLEFHLPTHSSASDTITTEQLAPRERVIIEGPHGQFVINAAEPNRQAGDETGEQSKCLIAIGEGFAAIKPLVELILSLERDIPCILIWIASESIGHYQHNLARSWGDVFDNVAYLPLNSVDEFNIEHLQNTGVSPADTDFYISGNNSDSDRKRLCELLTQAGVPDKNLTVDTMDNF